MTESADSSKPVFGLILMGGPLSGALVRDIRLANELVSRGFEVHVWWAMDQGPEGMLDERIPQRWLFNAFRYYGWGRGAGSRAGRTMTRFFRHHNRSQVAQNHPALMERLMQNMLRLVANGVENDMPIVNAFARDLSATKVTHVLPMLSVLCPWVEAARKKVDHKVKYLVTFQGYELYINYARRANLEAELYKEFSRVADESDFKAIAVSEDYRDRVEEDIGVSKDRIVAIPPGIPPAKPTDCDDLVKYLKEQRFTFQEGVPLITFLGRRDSEKGIDLLLYAAAILKKRGINFQLAICGPTLFGGHYAEVCEAIAENLRITFLNKRFIKNEVRNAIFRISECVVYPSIHREPFGMVPVEAMSHGTPVVVPDTGGVASVVEADSAVGGLRFRIWDSGDLADQLERIIENSALRNKLSEDAPKVAEYFSVKNMGNRILDHLGLPRWANAPANG